MLGKLFGFLASITGAAFLGYCVYFDHKRRSDPDYKKKLYERRRNLQKANVGQGEEPDVYSEFFIERYFMHQITQGEKLISEGYIEAGVTHLINAIVVCRDPPQLIHVLQTSLPNDIFNLMIQKMQGVDVSRQREDLTGASLSATSIDDFD